MKGQKTKKETKGKAQGGNVALGIGAIAALAGAYFLYGSADAPKNRKKIKGWMLKAKGEVLEKLEKVTHATEDQYATIVDTVLKKYGAVKSIDTTEVDALGKDLKKHWKNFQKELKKVKKA